MAFIELQNVEKKYTLGKQEIKALDKVNLKINKGDFVSVLGPSGSGKSTLLHVIGALDRPNKGKVMIQNKNISGFTDKKAARFRNSTIGFIFQTFNLIPTLTAVENVLLPLAFDGITGKKAKKIATTALEAVNLDKRMDHKPSELSGGELQRVSIARAITNNPQIVLADEPTGNLDSKTGKKIMNLLRELNRKGHTVIMVTHNKVHARYAERVISFLDGGVISDGKD